MLFAVTPFRSRLRNKAETLRSEIEARAKQGWRLVTSFVVGGSAHHLVWRRTPSNASKVDETPEYQVLPLPSFLECLRRRSFSPWTNAVEEQLARLPAGGFIQSYCSIVGYVLCYRPKSTATELNREEYGVIRRSPDWKRTLFGFSWLPVLSQELTNSCTPESEIVAYLGNDLFLIRSRQDHDQRIANESCCGPRTYKLAMWPSWKRIGLSGTSQIASWFQQEADQGWELLSHHSGMIFLFGS